MSDCQHQRTAKERYSGGTTGDYICLDCHETFPYDPSKHAPASADFPVPPSLPITHSVNPDLQT